MKLLLYSTPMLYSSLNSSAIVCIMRLRYGAYVKEKASY